MVAQEPAGLCSSFLLCTLKLLAALVFARQQLGTWEMSEMLGFPNPGLPSVAGGGGGSGGQRTRRLSN